MLEHWSTALSGPADTESEGPVDRPPSPQSDRPAGGLADTGWKALDGRHSAGRKLLFLNQNKTGERRPTWTG